MRPGAFYDWMKAPARPALVMGICNVTPDSFSDANKYLEPAAAIAHARQMLAEGADLIDIGGESTRPGALPVPAEEQIRRVAPVIRAISFELDVAISVDTTRAEVAAAALDAGAVIVNDITAGRDDAGMLPLVAGRGAAIILMHMQGTPRTMQENPVYGDVVAEVSQFLLERAAAAQAAGIDPAHILLDPGIGFGKTAEHNLQLLRATEALAKLPYPLVIGTSRKRFIGMVTGESAPEQRVFGTAATVGWAVANGAAVVRVHDVRPMVQVSRMVRAIQGGTIAAGN